MQIFLSAFDDIPDPRADNARHDLGELLVIAFVAVLCGATTCAGMATFGRAKESFFRDFLNLKHAIPSHDTFSTVFRMLDPKALDAAFGKVLAEVAALLREGDVIAIDGKALRGARGKSESARTRMMVSAYAARLRLTLASCAADNVLARERNAVLGVRSRGIRAIGYLLNGCPGGLRRQESGLCHSKYRVGLIAALTVLKTRS
ncbi:ISAs1 family transposase [Paracoccus aestuariivivens]|uniref:ISAs1 family transposase n=1 Tax=Paracoccus aestuariivivens TaxID=1820333 RepID=UPI001FE7C750|nr:ISAs1 family transposase [Paracoccus aestuariivivens]